MPLPDFSWSPHPGVSRSAWAGPPSVLCQLQGSWQLLNSCLSVPLSVWHLTPHVPYSIPVPLLPSTPPTFPDSPIFPHSPISHFPPLPCPCKAAFLLGIRGILGSLNTQKALRGLHIPANPGTYPTQSFGVIHSQSSSEAWLESTSHMCPASSVGRA